MLVVSSKKFREDPKSYFDKVDIGMDVLIRKGKSKSYRIVPVEEKDDSLMTKEEFLAEIEAAEQDYREGRYVSLNSREEIIAYFDSL